MSKSDILKKAEEYMKLKYRFELTEDKAEGGFVISCPDLIGCMSSGKRSKKPSTTARTHAANGSSPHLKAEWKYPNINKSIFHRFTFTVLSII